MKLKTLKDFEKLSDHMEIDHYTLKELKQEAIKWVKDIKASQPYQELSGPDAVQMWIKIFFNLTDEDLK